MSLFIFIHQVTEGSMAYKMAALEAPPSTNKPPKPEGAQKDVTSAAAVKDEPVSKAEEYGYIVTNQRYGTLTSSTNQETDQCL